MADEEVPRVIKDLAEAFSKQSKYSNQIWLGLVIATAVVLWPDTQSGKTKLPFSLATVDEGTYTVVGFLILIVLTLAFCQAYAGTHNAARLARKLIGEIEGSEKKAATRAKIF